MLGLSVRGQGRTVYVLVVSMFSLLSAVVFWNVGRKLVPTPVGLSLSSLLLLEDLRSFKKQNSNRKINPCPSGEEGRSFFAFYEVRSMVFCFNSRPLDHSLKHW